MSSLAPCLAPNLSFQMFQHVSERRTSGAFKHELDDWTLLEWSGAMCGEAGEAANLCKKIKRKIQGFGGEWAKRRDPTMDELLDGLADEIGDVVAYAALLASAAGLDFATCVARKFDKVSVEAGWEGTRLIEMPRSDEAKDLDRDIYRGPRTCDPIEP